MTRRRVAVVVVAASLLAGATGAAWALHDRAKPNGRVHVASEAPTTTSAEVPTTALTTSTSTSTSTVRDTSAIPGPAPTTSPSTEAPTTPTTLEPQARTADLEASLILADTTLVAEQPTTFAIRVRNVSGHRVDTHNLSVLIAGADIYDPNPWGIIHGLGSLDAGEERTVAATVTPRPEAVGIWPLRPALVEGIGPREIDGWRADFLPAGKPVIVTVQPPGYVEDQPLDPALSRWQVTLSSEANRVRVGESVMIHVAMHNAGTQPQTTSGYGSLEIACWGLWGHGRSWGHLLDAATIGPGAAQTFSVAFNPEFGDGDATCQLDIVYGGAGLYAVDGAGIAANELSIQVLPAAPTTSTT